MSRELSFLQQEQTEKLVQIGDYLRQVREDSDLSLEDVAARTLIQSRLLRAIEQGKLNQLPESVYIQGFIKRYADALGLDGNQFADAFPTERATRMPRSSWKDSPAAQLRPLHLYLAYIALIMVSVSMLSHIVARSTSNLGTTANTGISNNQVPASSSARRPSALPKSTPKSAPSTAKSQPKPSAEPTITAGLLPALEQTDAKMMLTQGANKPVRVEIKLTAQSWLRIVSDGKTQFEGVLPEGTERLWTADSQLTVRAGNAGGVTVAYNSGQAQRLGDPGAVEEKTFSPSTASASSLSPSNN